MQVEAERAKTKPVVAEGVSPAVVPGVVRGDSTVFPEIQFLDDDIFSHIYAFKNPSALVRYWNQNKVSSTLTPQQIIAWGIEPVPVKTMVKVVRRFPIRSSYYYEVVPMAGKYQGWTLYVIQFDLYPNLR